MYYTGIRSARLIVFLVPLFLFALPANALDQWATGVVGYTSQYGAVGWSARQAIGPPNTFGYGDSQSAWAPAALNGTLESITLSYDVPVFATSVTVREVWGNGFVKQIDLIDTSNVTHTVWANVDKAKPGSVVESNLTFAQTTYAVQTVKVTISTDKNLRTREEIDAVMLSGEPAHGVVDEWATAVLDFSSQYSSANWSAAQAVGAPDTGGYGDYSTSWAPANQNNSLEYLTVQFPQPLYSSGVTVRETYGNGFVYQVDVVDMGGGLHTVWSGTDPSLPGSPANFTVTWPATTFLVQGIKVYVDTSHDLSAWEEIDAIQMHGVTSNFADLVLSPSKIIGGKTVTGKVILFVPAQTGGVTLSLTSANPTVAVVPATVTIPAGAFSASFTINTTGVAATTPVVITAALSPGDTQSSTLTVQPAALSSLSLTPPTPTGGKNVIGKVTLTGAAPPGGAVVALADTNIAAYTDVSVTVPEGATSATFTVTTTPVIALTTGVVSATYIGVTKGGTLDVLPPDLSKVTLAPTSVKGGVNSVATVLLTGVGATDYVVNISSNNPGVGQPVDSSGNPITTVTVPSGADHITFTIKTTTVLTGTTVTISGNLGGTTKTAPLTVKP